MSKHCLKPYLHLISIPTDILTNIHFCFQVEASSNKHLYCIKKPKRVSDLYFYIGIYKLFKINWDLQRENIFMPILDGMMCWLVRILNDHLVNCYSMLQMYLFEIDEWYRWFRLLVLHLSFQCFWICVIFECLCISFIIIIWLILIEYFQQTDNAKQWISCDAHTTKFSY